MVNKMLPDRPLSATELQEMNAFLIDKGISTIFHMHGLSCGLGGSLHRLPVEMDSMIALLGKESQFTSMVEINQFASFLIRLNRQVVNELQYPKTFMPLIDYEPVVQFQYASLTDQQKQHLGAWCGGYLLGLSADSERWGKIKHRSSMKSLLFPIAILGDTATFDAWGNEKDGLTAKERAEMLDEATLLLPSIVSMIYQVFSNSAVEGRGRNVNASKSGTQ